MSKIKGGLINLLSSKSSSGSEATSSSSSSKDKKKQKEASSSGSSSTKKDQKKGGSMTVASSKSKANPKVPALGKLEKEDGLQPVGKTVSWSDIPSPRFSPSPRNVPSSLAGGLTATKSQPSPPKADDNTATTAAPEQSTAETQKQQKEDDPSTIVAASPATIDDNIKSITETNDSTDKEATPPLPSPVRREEEKVQATAIGVGVKLEEEEEEENTISREEKEQQEQGSIDSQSASTSGVEHINNHSDQNNDKDNEEPKAEVVVRRRKTSKSPRKTSRSPRKKNTEVDPDAIQHSEHQQAAANNDNIDNASDHLVPVEEIKTPPQEPATTVQEVTTPSQTSVKTKPASATTTPSSTPRNAITPRNTTTPRKSPRKSPRSPTKSSPAKDKSDDDDDESDGSDDSDDDEETDDEYESEGGDESADFFSDSDEENYNKRVTESEDEEETESSKVAAAVSSSVNPPEEVEKIDTVSTTTTEIIPSKTEEFVVPPLEKKSSIPALEKTELIQAPDTTTSGTKESPETEMKITEEEKSSSLVNGVGSNEEPVSLSPSLSPTLSSSSMSPSSSSSSSLLSSTLSPRDFQPLTPSSSFSESLSSLSENPLSQSGSKKQHKEPINLSLGISPKISRQKRARSFQSLVDADHIENTATEATDFTDFTDDSSKDSPRRHINDDDYHPSIEEMGDDLANGGLLGLMKFLGGNDEVTKEEVLDDSEEGILYNIGFGSLVIKGGTLQKLVEKICDSLYKDENFTDEFLDSFNYFTTPQEVLQLVSKQFDILPEVDPLWAQNSQQQNRIKIFAFVKKWISTQFLRDMNNDAFIKDLNHFIDSKMGPLKYLKIQELSDLILEKRVEANYLLEGEKKAKFASKDKKKKSPKSSFNSLEELLEGNPRLFAEQVTLYESEIIRSIKSHEYFKQKWSGKGGKSAAPNIVRFIQHFNKLSFWFSYYITSQRQFKKRVERLEAVLKLSEEFIALRNYNGAREVYAGLSVAAVKRLKDTWEELPKPTAKIFSNLEELLSPSLNYKAEREAAQEGINSGQGCIPFFGRYLSDLTFTEDGNPSRIEPQGYINFAKFRKLSQIFRNIQHLQRKAGYPKIKANDKIRQLIEEVQERTEQEVVQLSCKVLPRGCKKPEKEIEKENLEKDSTILACVFLGDESGEKKDFTFNIHQTVKYCKDKACHKLSLNKDVKLSPSEYALYIPNKGDFKKNGGFKLEEDRAIGSYRLKENEKLILCKRKEAQAVTKITDEDTILVSIKSTEHQAKKMLKLPLSTPIEEVKQQFLKKITGSANNSGDYLLCYDVTILVEGTVLSDYAFQKLVELSLMSIADYHKLAGGITRGNKKDLAGFALAAPIRTSSEDLNKMRKSPRASLMFSKPLFPNGLFNSSPSISFSSDATTANSGLTSSASYTSLSSLSSSTPATSSSASSGSSASSSSSGTPKLMRSFSFSKKNELRRDSLG
eukprot:TRINITY_DN2525_c0_g2_i5.p1 TRINITY_DN2525_c0_g2~~TRINITY_DN2525_c0_g2_i5.p1  ORF type:complete len:1455 (+),score=458.01 TRINITY_DN2525_c0_g2_i5:2598-6962(+)